MPMSFNCFPAANGNLCPPCGLQDSLGHVAFLALLSILHATFTMSVNLQKNSTSSIRNSVNPHSAATCKIRISFLGVSQAAKKTTVMPDRRKFSTVFDEPIALHQN